MSRVRIVTPTVLVQPMATGGLLLSKVIPARPTLTIARPSTSAYLGGSKIRDLKLEMPEKYIGSRVPTVSGWL